MERAAPLPPRPSPTLLPNYTLLPPQAKHKALACAGGRSKHVPQPTSRRRDRCSSASAKLARSRQAHSSAPRRRGSVLGNLSEISLYFTEVPAYFPSSKRHLLAAVGIFLRIFPESESEGDPLISLKLSGNSYMGQVMHRKVTKSSVRRYTENLARRRQGRGRQRQSRRGPPQGGASHPRQPEPPGA